MPKRLKIKRDSTPAPVMIGRDETVTTSMRKIDNGYIVRQERFGGKDGYECHEMFSAEPIQMTVAKAIPKGFEGQEALTTAVAALEKSK